MQNLLKNLGTTKQNRTKKNRTPKEIVELYLNRRGFEEICEGDYSHFTFVDPKDETLGDYVTECDVLLNFLEADSDEQIDNFEISDSQMTKLRQSVLAYMTENPDINDCRLDMLYLINTDDEKVEIRHEIGTVRLMLLSKD